MNRLFDENKAPSAGMAVMKAKMRSPDAVRQRQQQALGECQAQLATKDAETQTIKDQHRTQHERELKQMSFERLKHRQRATELQAAKDEVNRLRVEIGRLRPSPASSSDPTPDRVPLRDTHDLLEHSASEGTAGYYFINKDGTPEWAKAEEVADEAYDEEYDSNAEPE